MVTNVTLPYSRSIPWTVIILVAGLVAGFPTHLWAQLELEYQSRGQWHEGVRAKPVSGLDIELISVLVDYQDNLEGQKFPNKVKLKFYLERDQKVSITVRELDYQAYYWLDQVEKPEIWKQGFGNEFVWPAKPILKALSPPIALYDLGALVRLEKPVSSTDEQIAPGILYHTNLPDRIEGYVFTLKTGEDSRLNIKVIQKATGKEIKSQRFRKKRAGRPFTIYWNAKDAPAGTYKLEIKGFSLVTNEPIHKIITFYHQPFLAADIQ